MSDTPSRGVGSLGDEELVAVARSLPAPTLTQERQEEMRTAFLSTVRGLRSGARVRARSAGRRRLLVIGRAVLACATAAAAWSFGSVHRQGRPERLPVSSVPVQGVAQDLPPTPQPTMPAPSPDRSATVGHARKLSLRPSKGAKEIEPGTDGEVAFARGWSSLRAEDFNTAADWFARAASSQQGALVQDALFWQGVALDRAGRFATARQVLTDFLSRYPESDRTGEASVMLGWLLVRSDELRAARAHFERALEDPAERVRNSAQAGLAAAQQQARGTTAEDSTRR